MSRRSNITKYRTPKRPRPLRVPDCEIPVERNDYGDGWNHEELNSLKSLAYDSL
jgi:hypothetical protein